MRAVTEHKSWSKSECYNYTFTPDNQSHQSISKRKNRHGRGFESHTAATETLPNKHSLKTYISFLNEDELM